MLPRKDKCIKEKKINENEEIALFGIFNHILSLHQNVLQPLSLHEITLPILFKFLEETLLNL